MLRSILRSGTTSILAIGLAACLYSMASGGGFPSHIKSVAVIPFENETPNPDIASEVHLQLRKELSDRLGLREAPETRANAIVRGKIVRYESDVPVAFSADPSRATSARRKVQVSVDVEIMDQTTGKVLFKRAAIVGAGEYAERDEPAGRKQAVEKLVAEIIEGAQSQW